MDKLVSTCEIGRGGKGALGESSLVEPVYIVSVMQQDRWVELILSEEGMVDLRDTITSALRGEYQDPQRCIRRPDNGQRTDDCEDPDGV